MSWTVYNSSGQLLQATDLPDNSVDSDQYVDGSIDTAHMAASQITNALMADDAIGVAELSATGTASSSTFLRGDNAWAAAGGLSSDSTSGTRSAASGSGTVAYTGSSFTPTAVIILAANDDNDDSVSVGFADSAADEGTLELTRMSGTPRFVTGPNVIAISSNSGNDSQNAVISSFNSDGVTLTWTKGGSGTQCSFRILYLR